MISAVRHCHARKVLLGKAALSTNSIYMDANHRPVIVDLSTAQHVRHSEILRKLKHERRFDPEKKDRRKEQREADTEKEKQEQRKKAAAKADVKMLPRHLVYMPIETMLGKRPKNILLHKDREN